MGTKNNPKNRKAVEKKTFNGKEVVPILYHGINSGHGKYIAAKYAGAGVNLIVDESGRPLQWDELNSSNQ